MNELAKIFNYEQKEIRTVVKNNEPWFVAKDVCEILEISNHKDAVGRLSEKMKGVATTDTPGGKQEMTVITEAGVYKLVFTSRKPEADRFTDWIATEVIPSIRKYGMYATDELLDNPDFLIETITKLKEERIRRQYLELENAKKQQIICELQPKATYYDLVLQNHSTIAISHIAKDYGMSAMKFNELLHELRVQYKLQNVWLLYAEYQDKGYTQSKTHIIDSEKSKMHTYWTQAGRLFLYQLLKNEKGLLPLIEREIKVAQ